MENIYCLYLLVFLVPILMTALGLVMIFKKDWAWWLVAWMYRVIKPQRTPEWEHYATINGVILIVGGLVSILFLLSKLRSAHLGY